MVSKDQAIGGAILIVCILVAAAYTVAIFKPDLVIKLFGLQENRHLYSESLFRLWAVIIPVFIAFIAIMFIGAWIGWTMATTPPPKPIEEITTEIEDKKEETPAENGK
ncbi:MAG: transcriptional regulator [Nitrososphaerota archaeon]|jgi:predicted DNA-binding transcriptional regulator|nr:transcriptional regulator [Nitrososphaerota archaeon]